MQFMKFQEYCEAQEAQQKCGKCGVMMDPSNPNRALRVLEDPQGGLAGTYCPNCYDGKKKELEMQKAKNDASDQYLKGQPQ